MQLRTTLLGILFLAAITAVATALRIQVPVLVGQLFAMLLSLAPQSASACTYLAARFSRS